VHIGPERVALELERAQKGALLLLQRQEFENKVQQAALAQEQITNPPRFVKTIYAAHLVGEALVGGAEWSVVHTAPGPGLLPLVDFNLALHKRVKVDAADGIIGDIDGKTPALWIAQPGQPSAFFDWTRRGTPTADGLHFDLEVPACANAHLELSLPANRQLAATKPGLLVTGPHPSADASQRLWKLSFAGRSRVEFVVQQIDSSDPLLLSTVQVRQELSPNRVLADFEFQIEALHGDAIQLVFSADAPLVPFDVTLGAVEVKGWQWRPLVKGKSIAGGELVVPLPAPYHGPLPVLQVRCLAPVINAQGSWTSPGLRLRGGLTRGETLKLIIAPEAQLDDWKARHFRLTGAIEEPDGTQLLTLVHGGVNLPRLPASITEPALGLVYANLTPPLQRPSAVLRARTTELLVQQQLWWQIDAATSLLTCELACLPSRGRLTHLPLKLPADSQVEQVHIEPRASLGSWAVAGDQNPVLLIDLAQPATPATPVRVKLQLRLPLRATLKEALTLPLADIEPLVPCLREGALAISVHPHWRAEVVQPSVTAALAPEDEGRWQRAQPDYFFAFRGAALTGSICLQAQAPQFHAHLSSDVFLGNTRGMVSARLIIEPSSGSLDHLDLLVPAALAEPWRIKNESPATHPVTVQRLSGLDVSACLLMIGGGDPLKALSPVVTQHGAQRWRIRFTEPVRSRTMLTLEAPFDPVDGAKSATTAERTWAIPVVAVAGAEPFEANLAMHLRGPEVNGQPKIPEELKETPRTAAPVHGGQHLWRVFSYEGSRPISAAPTLRVKVRTGAELPAQESCDTASLTTYVEPGGRQVHHFHFRLWNWRKRDLPIMLPAEAAVLAAQTEGRWLAGLAQHSTTDGLQVDLPSSTVLGVQHFDLYYATPSRQSSWAAWDTLEAPLPQLPVGKPLDQRRSWVLPPGVVPVGDAWQRSGGPPAAAGLSLARFAERTWHVGQPLLEALLSEAAAPEWAMQQRQHLCAAETALRKQFGPDTSWVLGPTLEALVFEHLTKVPVVVDAEALSAAGLSMGSSFAKSGVPIGEDPWSRGQLIFVPTPAGLLLTTRSQWQQWGGGDYAGPGALTDAIAQAVQTGHDSAGRLFTAAQWLRGGIYQPAMLPGAVPTPAALLPHSFGPDWTVWDATAAAQAPQSLVVIRPVSIHLAGIVLSAVLALAWYGSGRRWPSPRQSWWRVRVLLIAVAVALVSWLTLPAPFRAAPGWPAAMAAVLLLGSYFRWLLQHRPAVSTTASMQTRSAIAAAVVLLHLAASAILLQPAAAQVQEINTVLILPGPAGAPERQDVLVAPELLKKLDSLIHRSPADVRSAVLIAAHYEITLTEQVALCKAEYQLSSFGDKTTVIVPLAGIELREGALLDGALVHPVAIAGGYSVPVIGRGNHQLTLFFNVRLQTAGSHRDLRFTVPRLHQSRLQVEVPLTWPDTYVASGLGMVQVGPEGAKTRSLNVELGRESTVHLRWPRSDPSAPAPKISVRELYWWDLRAPGGECTAVLEYKVSGGVSHFVVAVPDTLEPRAVAVTGDGPEGDEAARPRLQKWYLTAENNQWRLHIQLQHPASGAVAVTIRLVPRFTGSSATLRLPLLVPLGAQAVEGVIGYRLDGLEGRGKGYNMQTVALKPEQFIKPWQAAGIREAVTPSEAFTFRNRQPDAALVVTIPPAKPAIDQDLQFTVHPDRVELFGTLKTNSPASELLLVEWEMPPVLHIAEITGDNVRAWSRPADDNRVQVWLKQPARVVTLNIRGWQFFAKGQAGQPLRWVLPCLRCPTAASTHTVVHLVEGHGVHLDADIKKLLNLTPLPAPATQAWVCQAPQGYYRAEFVHHLVALPSRVQAISSVEAREGKLHLGSSWQVQIPHSEATTFEVRVDGWPSAAFKLEGPAEVIVAKLLLIGTEQGWKVSVPAGASRRFLLKLAGQRPALAGTALDLPAIRLDRADWSEHWLIVHGPGLEVERTSGLSVVKETADAALPPGLPERLQPPAELYKVLQPAWKLRLVARASPTTADLQVLFGAQETAFGEGFGWVHQAFYLIHAKDSAELILELPPAATCLTAAVDGEQVAPRLLADDRLALPLPSGASAHRVRLRWFYGSQQEAFAQPRLAAPRLQAAPGLAMVRTLTVPPGYCLVQGTAVLDQTPALEAAWQELARAEALGTASHALIEQYQKAPDETLKTQILLWQKRFVGRCRLAYQDLQAATSAGSGVAELRERLEDLRRRNSKWLRDAGLDKLRAQAEKAELVGDKEAGPWLLPTRGTVYYWRAAPSVVPPVVEMLSACQEQQVQGQVAAQCVLLTLLVLLLLTTWPRLLRRLGLLVPALALVGALAGTRFWGISLVGAGLFLLAVLGQSVLIADWLQRRRLQPAVAGSAVGSAAKS
jgi:hypothetical protein